MSDPHPTGSLAQFRSLMRSFVLDPGLLFGQFLSAEHRLQVITQEVGQTCDRIFTPVVTLCTFLGQILSDDHTCQAAVNRLIAWRVARGLPPCSADTGGYCKARQRCLRRSCRDWCATPPTDSSSRPPTAGSSTAAPSRWSMARRSPCPIPRRIRPPTPSTAIKPPAVASRCPHCRVAQSGHRRRSRRGDRSAQGETFRRKRAAAQPAWTAETGRHCPDRPWSLLLFRGGAAVGSRCGCRHAAAHEPTGGLPLWPSSGTRGSHGGVDQAPTCPLDGSGDLRHNPRDADHP